MIARRWLRTAIFGAAAVSAVLCSSGVAFAHVTVLPTAAAAGSETTFTFRVPTEKSDASTVKIVVALPSATPIPVVSVQPVPGWRATIANSKLAEPIQTDDGPVTTIVSDITWTAVDPASAIAPGQFQQFAIAAGPLPDAKLLLFKVLQYYSDGSVVRWIDPPLKGDEPAHPAPAVTVGTDSASGGAGASQAAPGAADDRDIWIATAAFVAGLLGLAAGTAALVVARRSSRGSPS